MLIEIKREVNSSLVLVNRAALCQTLLKCYYASLKYKVRRVVGCLSDSSTWHFFSCRFGWGEEGKLLHVDGANSITVQDMVYDELGHTIIKILLHLIHDV